MLLYAQTWLPLLTITLTAAIFFGVASFHDGRRGGSAYGHSQITSNVRRSGRKKSGLIRSHHARCSVVRPAIGRS